MVSNIPNNPLPRSLRGTIQPGGGGGHSGRRSPAWGRAGGHTQRTPWGVPRVGKWPYPPVDLSFPPAGVALLAEDADDVTFPQRQLRPVPGAKVITGFGRTKAAHSSWAGDTEETPRSSPPWLSKSPPSGPCGHLCPLDCPIVLPSTHPLGHLHRRVPRSQLSPSAKSQLVPLGYLSLLDSSHHWSLNPSLGHHQ